VSGLAGFVNSELQHKRIHLVSSREIQVQTLHQKLFGQEDTPEIIYIREVYSTFCREVKESFSKQDNMVLVAGSRGIGKSVFGALMVLELVDDGHIVIYEHFETKLLVIGVNPHPEALKVLNECLTKDGFLELTISNCTGVYTFPTESRVLSQFSLRQEAYLVMDLGIRTEGNILNLDGKAQKLYLSSPNQQLYKFKNFPNLVKLCMPTWSWEELKVAREKVYPDIPLEELETSFRLFGGIPRTLLQTKKDKRENEFQIQLNSLTLENVEKMFSSPFI
jgi:hypothetical protein